MKSRIASILLFYIVAWCISPPLSYGGIYRLIALAAVAVLCYFFLERKKWKINRAQLIAVFIAIYMFVVNIIIGDAVSQRLSAYILLALLLMKEGGFEDKTFFAKEKWFVPGVFLLCILWNVSTLQGIAENPNIMRILAKNTAAGPSYAKRGIGGYGYMYTIVALLPLGIKALFSKHHSKLFRILAAVFVLSSYILAFNSQYFLVVLIVILMPILFLIYRIKDLRLRLGLLAVFLVFFLAVLFNIESILKTLMETLSGTGALLRKIQDLYDIVQGTSVEDTEFSVRLSRYILALERTFESPLWGHFSYKYTGNHSYIMDATAQYGLPIGLTFIYIAFIYPFRKMKKTAIASQVMMLTVLIIALLNTVAFAVGSIMYIVLPMYEQMEQGMIKE